jgi:hypothetical protein
MTSKQLPIPVERIEEAIFLIRGHKVMLDADLAELYGVTTKRLNEQVRRSISRFPIDFMFQLDEQKASGLRSQIATSKEGRGGRRYLPYVFTEQGVAMLSSILHSERAIQVNIAIMRVFVRLREMMATHKELAFKLIELEERLEGHDEQIQNIFEAIRQLMSPPERERKKIGFVNEPAARYGKGKGGGTRKQACLAVVL